ncbi:MAG: NAD(P)H-dependent oxidoreductase [Myxococcota bacterium]|jgi:putative NADPH-quinone reductase|nr:NAD(P)H-dependent oxidoreductase [Myxococcota bacterium]
MTSDILVITGHPNPNSLSDHLASEYAARARELGASVEILRLSELEFDPILHHGYAKIQPLEPDLVDAQRKIMAARHVVFVYPMWWVGAPALLRGFIERTFLPGWAFKYDEGSAIPRKLLSGRSARVIMTMDAPGYWYRFIYRRAATHSFVQGILKFSGFARVKTTHIFGVREMAPDDISSTAKKVREAAAKDVRKELAVKTRSPARDLITS